MADENENTPNLLNYPPIVNELQSWKGSGNLSWPNHSVAGDFVLSRLLNGKLRFVFMPKDRDKSSIFSKLHNFKFDGVAEDESLISTTGIHFSRGYPADEMPKEIIWVGFAQSATRHIDADADTVSIRCDLTNYFLNWQTGDIEVQLDGFTVIVTRLSWRGRDEGIEDHAIAYNHASLSTCLKVENIPLNKTNQAIDCLQNVAALLSIACRGEVSIAARHIWNQEKGKLDSFFEAPPTPNRRWEGPLIPSNNVKEFLLAAYQRPKNREQSLELAFIADHYLQALTLRFIWPMSVGIFTAMESLKTAFFNQNWSKENESYIYWVVPPEDFESNKGMIKEVIDVLVNHFPRFGKLAQNEKHSLEAQIGKGLMRRSYKTQLKRMLDLLNVEYKPSELQFFVNTRNSLIHEGTPVPTNTPLSEYDDKSAAAFENVKKAAGLFERALLSFLNYEGSYKLFDEGFK